MFQHNWLIIIRNFKRFKGAFFINLIGLSTGLSCALLIYLWVNDELKMDKFHEKDSQLFQVIERAQHSDRTAINEHTAGLLPEALVKDMPEVEYAAGAGGMDEGTLTVGENNIKANGFYAGKDYFNIFTYPLIEGNKSQVLMDKNAIVISQDLAMRLFKTTENVIGKTVEFQHEKHFQVSGIFKGTPPNSSKQFDFVFSFQEYKEVNPSVLDWKYNTSSAYVVLKKGTDINRFNQKIAGLIKTNTGDAFRTLSLRPYSSAYLYGRYDNGVQVGGRIEYVRLLSFIAIFILVIACINFMNLSTAKASRRIKEVGIKKAIGATREALIFQYIGESMVMAFLSLFFAVVMVAFLLPSFNDITGKHLHLTFDTRIILSFLGITIFTGFMSGSYPAFYLSGFNPTAVLKGKLSTSIGELWIRKGLVIFQFTLSVILIVAVLIIYKQIEFIQTKSLGYNKENIIYFDKEGRAAENLDNFLVAAKNVPGVVNAASIGQNIVGSGLNTFLDISWEGKDPNEKIVFEWRPVSYDLIETLGIQMATGRAFSRGFGGDSSKIIVNEAAVKAMGLKDPVGKIIDVQGSKFEVVGVTKDFHFASLHEKVNPLFFVLRPDWTHKIMIKIAAGKENSAISSLQNFYQQYNSGFPFDYKFLDEDYQAQYAAEKRVSVLSRYFAGLAMLISCLGLFGLATFTAERRMKEIGIRKVLGSGEANIVMLLSADFSKMVFTGILIALPISYLIARSWLDKFAYSIKLEVWYFLVAGLLALLTAMLTVGVQALKAANMHPLKCLRDL